MRMLDRLRGGTYHMDRIGHIDNVCIDLGILSHTDSQGRIHLDVTADGSVTVTPRYERYAYEVRPRVQDRFLSAADKFAAELNVDKVRVVREGGLFFVEVPRADGGEIVTFADVMALDPNMEPGEVLLGLTHDGQQMTLHLPSPECVHLIVVGMTGSGKSNLMRAMIMSTIARTKVAIFDPTREAGKDLRPLSGHPNVWRGGMFHTYDECERGLGILASGKGGCDGLLLVIVDEVPDLVRNRPAIRDHLGQLAQSGRHDGIHLILGAQHALMETLSSDVLRNMPVSAVGRMRDPQASYNATGRREIGAETLGGNGDFVLVAGDVRRFQAPLVTDAEIAKFQAAYPPKPPRLPPVCTGTVSSVRAAAIARRGQGRPTEEPDAQVVAEVRDYITKHGEAPSSNWIYRVSRHELGAGYGRDKAQRAIDAAMGV